MFKKIKDKLFITRFGELVFTFPNGKKLYTIKDNSLHKIPAKNYNQLQENHNYLAFLGATKANIIANNKLIADYCSRGLKGENTYESINKLIGTRDIFLTEYDSAIERLVLNTFDAFFFFENENPFETNEAKRAKTLELKRKYLNDYPYFNSFFFQLVKKRYKNLLDIWSESIDFALAQITLSQMIKEMKQEVTQLNLQTTKPKLD